MRSRNFGLRIGLSDDVDVRDRSNVVLDISVNVDAGETSSVSSGRASS